MSEHLGSITAADDDRHIGAEPRIVSIEETSMNVIIQLIQKNRVWQGRGWIVEPKV